MGKKTGEIMDLSYFTKNSATCPAGGRGGERERERKRDCVLTTNENICLERDSAPFAGLPARCRAHTWKS
jgi:hypothetical protein